MPTSVLIIINRLRFIRLATVDILEIAFFNLFYLITPSRNSLDLYVSMYIQSKSLSRRHPCDQELISSLHSACTIHYDTGSNGEPIHLSTHSADKPNVTVGPLTMPDRPLYSLCLTTHLHLCIIVQLPLLLLSLPTNSILNFAHLVPPLNSPLSFFLSTCPMHPNTVCTHICILPHNIQAARSRFEHGSSALDGTCVGPCIFLPHW